MKLFLILASLSISCIALAQNSTEDSLFPELSGFSTANYKKLDAQSKETVVIPNEESSEANVEPPLDKSVTEDEDLFTKQDTPESVQDSIDPMEEIEESEEDDNQQKIVLTITDIHATLTSNRNASFCSATFVIGNALKKEIKSFSGDFTIGSVTKKFLFKNIAKQNVFAKKYVFTGTSCEQITNEPKLDIQSCQVEGWSEKKCKEKVQFVPVPKEQDMISE